MMNHHIYDVIIIGGGPGGLSAALYSARARLKTLLVESKNKTGGLCATTSELDNYPGIYGCTGPELMVRFTEHAQHYGAEITRGNVQALQLSEDGTLKTLLLSDNRELKARSVIISTGTCPRILGIPGEREFAGRGVSYCATCDADFYTDLDVVVVGSGNTAVEEAVFLTRYVNKVTMIVMHDENHLDADMISREQAFSNPKINFVWNSTLAAVIGDELVNAVEIMNIKTGNISRIATDGVFMFVGLVPQTQWLTPLQDQLPLSPSGHIEVNAQQETQLPGVFAVGDVCQKFLRQVVTAASDGAVAAVAASQYLEQATYWSRQMQSAESHLVLFWSPAESQSVDLLAMLEQKLNRNSERRFIPIDTYKNQRVAKQYAVATLPTLLWLEHGVETRRLTGPETDNINAIAEELYHE